MQPEFDRGRKRQQGMARARLLLKKHLHLLPGHPEQSADGRLAWRSFPWRRTLPAQQATIDATDIQQMEAALTRLRHRFPRALPEIVEDVDEWLARMECLLGEFKDCVHGGRSLSVVESRLREAAPRRWLAEFERLRKRHAGLRSLLDAIWFLELTGTDLPAGDLLGWLGDNELPLTKLLACDGLSPRERLDSALALCALRENMNADLVAALVDCLADKHTGDLSVLSPFGHVRALSKQLRAGVSQPFEIPPPPADGSTVRTQLLLLLREILELRLDDRNEVVALLAQLISREAVDHLAEWGTRVATTVRQFVGALNSIGNQPRMSRVIREEWLAAQADIEEGETVSLLLRDFRRAVSFLPIVARDRKAARAWAGFLSHFPADDWRVRLNLFSSIADPQHNLTHPHRPRRLEFLLNEHQRLFARIGVPPALLRQWRVNRLGAFRPAGDWLSELEAEELTRPQYKRALELLERATKLRPRIGKELLGSIIEFAATTFAISAAVEVIAELAADDDEYYFRWNIEAAVSLSDGSDTANILRTLSRDYRIREVVECLPVGAFDGGLRRLIAQLVLMGDRAQLTRLSTAIRLLRQVGETPPAVSIECEDAAWIDCYPTELRDPLRRLNACCPGAERAAMKILETDFPDNLRLEREATSLEAKLSDDALDSPQVDALTKRLSRLRERLTAPASASARRLHNLAVKLEQRTTREFLATYLRQCDDVVRWTVGEKYNAAELPAELWMPPTGELLYSVLALDGRIRDLGVQLLVAHFGAQSLPFDEHPANAGFRRSMAKLNVDLKSWLSDDFFATSETAGGELYRIAFTREPIDYLLMGRHFGTCLSPDDFNFFSTVANAVDVNKQVAYGKTASGRVIGRCLFALNDRGELQTYHRYSHNPNDDFSKAIDSFAARLADAMGTRLAYSGRVSKLVAGDWYDDGAIAYPADIDLHSNSSPVREALRSTAPDETIEAVRQASGCDDLLPILDALLRSEEFAQRTELAAPFVEYFGARNSLSFKERLSLAIAAERADLIDDVLGLLSPYKPSSLPRLIRGFACRECDLFHEFHQLDTITKVLIHVSPTIALRTIRATRMPHVRRDVDERSSVRIAALVDVHRALGRHKLVEQLTARGREARRHG